jgi:hypothetical protein
MTSRSALETFAESSRFVKILVGTDPFYYDSIFDNNTLIVEALVLVSPNAVIGQTRTITLSVDHGMNGVDNSSTINFVVGQSYPLTFNAVSELFGSGLPL